MPIIRVEVANKLSKEQKTALAEGITSVVTEVTKAPDQAVTIFITEYDNDNIAKAGILFSDRA
jgi:4-oxalocrotonate tautomerase family enzyme